MAGCKYVTTFDNKFKKVGGVLGLYNYIFVRSHETNTALLLLLLGSSYYISHLHLK